MAEGKSSLEPLRPLIPSMKTPPTWPVTSQRPDLLGLLHWGLRFQHTNVGQIHTFSALQTPLRPTRSVRLSLGNLFEPNGNWTLSFLLVLNQDIHTFNYYVQPSCNGSKPSLGKSCWEMETGLLDLVWLSFWLTSYLIPPLSWEPKLTLF